MDAMRPFSARRAQDVEGISSVLGRFCGTEGAGCGTTDEYVPSSVRQKRWATYGSPTASQLPLLGSNQDSPDPVPLRLSPPLRERSWSGLCLHLRRDAVRWLPPSLYTFLFRGLARRCRS